MMSLAVPSRAGVRAAVAGRGRLLRAAVVMALIALGVGGVVNGTAAPASAAPTWTITREDIALPPGVTSLKPIAINDLGHVLFTSIDSAQNGYLWSPESGMVHIELPGAQFSYANALNNHDQVAGTQLTPGFPFGLTQAWVWSPTGGSHILDGPDVQSTANAINDAGQVAGAVYGMDFGPRAVRWDSDGTRRLYTAPAPAEGRAIGPDGTIAGTWNDNGSSTAFVARTETAVTPIGFGLATRPTVSDDGSIPLNDSTGVAQWQDNTTVAWPGTGLAITITGTRTGLVLGLRVSQGQLLTSLGSFVWNPTSGVTTELASDLGLRAIGSSINSDGEVVGISTDALNGTTPVHGTFWSATNQAVDLGLSMQPVLINDHRQVLAYDGDQPVLLTVTADPEPPAPTTTVPPTPTTPTAASPVTPSAPAAVAVQPRFAG